MFHTDSPPVVDIVRRLGFAFPLADKSRAQERFPVNQKNLLINIICEDNGWGKSTFAAFIRAMFYGLDGDRKKNLAVRRNDSRSTKKISSPIFLL